MDRKPIDVLLVEDNEDDIILLEEALKDSRVYLSLHVVRDGVDALKFLRNEGEHAGKPTVQLVLLDLNMPRMSGREVLAEMHADPALSTLPVVVLTTSSADRDIQKCYQLGANCYISKPVDFNEFQRVVRMLDGFWFTVVALPS